MKDEMMLYGVTIGKRYTKKQKELFLNEVIKECQNKGLKTEFMTKKASFMNVCNLCVGDLENADIILACSYDTPTKSIYPNIKYFPFNPNLNSKEELKNTTIQCIMIALCLIVIYLGFKNFTLISLAQKIVRVILMILCSIVGFMCMFPHANKINFNRNSASVAILMKLIKNHKNEHIAYVFMDQTCSSFEGAKLLAEKYKNKKIIILDGLSEGDKMVCAHHGEIEYQKIIQNDWIDKEYKETKNILGLFDNAILLTSGSIINGQFVIKNTRTNKDINVNMPRLEKIYEILKRELEA